MASHRPFLEIYFKSDDHISSQFSCFKGNGLSITNICLMRTKVSFQQADAELYVAKH